MAGILRECGGPSVPRPHRESCSAWIPVRMRGTRSAWPAASRVARSRPGERPRSNSTSRAGRCPATWPPTSPTRASSRRPTSSPRRMAASTGPAPTADSPTWLWMAWVTGGSSRTSACPSILCATALAGSGDRPHRRGGHRRCRAGRRQAGKAEPRLAGVRHARRHAVAGSFPCTAVGALRGGRGRVDRACGPDQFTAARIADPDWAGTRARTWKSSATTRFGESGSAVDLEFADGRVVSAGGVVPPGAPSAPLGLDDVRTKSSPPPSACRWTTGRRRP